MAAFRPMDLDTISDTWLKLITLNSPSPAKPASIWSRSDGGLGPTGGPASPLSSAVRMIKPPPLVLWTRASAWPTSAMTSLTRAGLTVAEPAPGPEAQPPAAGRAPAGPAGDTIGNGLGGRRADADLFGRGPEQRQVSRQWRPHQQAPEGAGDGEGG